MNIYKAGHETETTQSLRLTWKERRVKFFQPQREFVPFRDSVYKKQQELILWLTRGALKPTRGCHFLGCSHRVSDTRGRTAVVGFLLAAQLLYQARDRAESSCCPKRKHRAWAFNRLTSAHSFHSPSYLSPSFSKHKLLVHVKIMTLHW